MDAGQTSRGLTSNDIAALLAQGPFAAAAARGSALVVGAGSPPRAIHATPSALNVFGVSDLAALNATLFYAESPGARRLRGLAESLPLGGAPRLESLRFYRGGLPIPLGWLCARIAGRDGEDLLVAAAPVRAIDSREEAPPTASVPTSPLAPESAHPRFTPMPLDGPVRFLWATDGEARFGAPDAALAARLGPHAPRAGETLDALRARVALDSADRWAEAIAARRTFSGLRLDWPEPGGARARVATLSGAPVFDREHGFLGFRGFGVFTGESVSLAVVETDAAYIDSATPTLSDGPVAESEPDIVAERIWPSRPDSLADSSAEPAAVAAPDRSADDTERFASAPATSAAELPFAPATAPEIDESRISLLEPDLITVMAALARAPEAEVSESDSSPASPSGEAAPPDEPVAAAPLDASVAETNPPEGVQRIEAPAEVETISGSPEPAPADSSAPEIDLVANAVSEPESRRASDGVDATGTPTTAISEGDSSGPPAASSDPSDAFTSASLAEADATASAPSEDQAEPIESPRAFMDDGSAAPTRFGRDGGAEIFVLRPPNASPSPPRIVPFRPGASLPAQESQEPPRPGDSVELSSHERDAFREIARTLGVRPRGPRSEVESVDPPPVPASPESFPEPSDRDLAALVDLLPIGALVMRSGEAIYLNRTLLGLLGYPTAEAFHAAGGLDSVFRGRDPAALLGEGGDIPLVAADGELMNVDARARSISWEGEPALLITIERSRALDHQAEVRAVEREARQHATAARDLAAALDLASDGMIRLDGAGRILGMNRRAEALLGYDQKEAAGESFLMLFAPGSQAEATAGLERVTREPFGPDAAPGLELAARERGGRAIPTRVDFGRLGGAGEPEYFALLRDLTQLKALERERETAREAAEMANARKTDFLARVSHEIRTPLHAILGFAEVIMEERFGPIGNERYKDYIKDIHASGRHVMSLANDLLDLSKIEAGKMELQFAPVDANRIIRECVALMQPQAARERIIMRLSLFDKLPNVMADERSLRQIMLNLMSNAVKFNEPGGQVIISTALDETGHTVIRVRDTGLGMNETELSVALEPFRRVSGGAKEGTGLGLPLTKALAEANHADFSIKSRKEQGTLVEVAFPSARAAQ